MSLDLELAEILDEFAVPGAFRAMPLDSACLKVWKFAEYVDDVKDWSAHTKHIEFAPGISFNLGTHEPLKASGDSKAMGLARWLLNLRILYKCYSIIGVRRVATSANSESMWCSCQVVSYFVDTLTDFATANIPGTKMRPTTGVLQLAELKLRTRVVELLRLGAEGGCLTFDDAFNKAFIGKQSLFHCALSPQTQVNNVAKTSLQHQVQKRAADSRTSDRQARRKTDSQSAEPRPRPQYSKYTPAWLFLEQVLVQVFECGSLLRRLGLLQRTP